MICNVGQIVCAIIDKGIKFVGQFKDTKIPIVLQPGLVASIVDGSKCGQICFFRADWTRAKVIKVGGNGKEEEEGLDGNIEMVKRSVMSNKLYVKQDDNFL